MDDQNWKILLVEDDEDDYILTRSLLEESKGKAFQLLWASDYEEGIALLPDSHPDAILVDYQLGARNGLDFVREAVAMRCKAPIIILTGQGSYEVDLQAMQSGAVDYLVKGQINATLLERTIRYAIERQQAQEALRQAHNELELRVQERTRELAKANEDLHLEINERKKVQAQLMIQTTALQAAANGIIITSPQGTILWCNPAFTQMTGYTFEEVINQTPNLLKSGKHPLEFFQSMWNTILTGRVWSGETINRRKDGTFFTEEQIITPVCDENNQITHFIAIKHDISERKRAEALIRQNAARAETLADVSQALVEAGPDYQAVQDVVTRAIGETLGDHCVIYLIGEDKKTVSLTAFYHRQPEAQRLLTRIYQESAQRAFSQLIMRVVLTGEPILIPEVSAAVLKSIAKSFTEYVDCFGISSLLSVPLRQGGKITGSLTATRDRDGQPYTNDDLLFLVSLADRAALAMANAHLYKDLENALQEEQTMRRQLVVAEKHSAMSRMVASVAHELNNPIQTIQNSLFLIKQDTDPDSEMATFIDMAVSEARRVSSLVSQLREIYRPSQSGPMQTLSLLRLVDEVRTLMSPHLQHQNVLWIQSQPPEGDKLLVKGISDQIKQIFINISLNAIEAMQPQGGELRIDYYLSSDRIVGISFEDQGPGIPTNFISQIFEPFFTTKDSGTGMGLSICYDIIERHGGQIAVESPPGKGARFTVWLPLTK